MTQQQLRLFCVECRPRGGGQADTFTFFVPALEPDEAILVAQASAIKARAFDRDVSDPFQDHADLEVRVGSYGPGDPSELKFGDWSLFSH